MRPTDQPVLDYESVLKQPLELGKKRSPISRTLVIALLVFVLGAMLGDDLGSGRYIPNPLTHLCSIMLLICTAFYMALRIASEERMPVSCRYLMAVA